MADHLYIGGNETTTFALTSGLWLLLSHLDVHAALLADRAKVKNFVEESLRLESPTQGLARVAVADTDGVAIPRGPSSTSVTQRPTEILASSMVPPSSTSIGPTPPATSRSR